MWAVKVGSLQDKTLCLTIGLIGPVQDQGSIMHNAGEERVGGILLGGDGRVVLLHHLFMQSHYTSHKGTSPAH